MALPVADCGISIFQNNTKKFEDYDKRNGSWKFLNCFGILHCAAGDIIKLAYMCGLAGTYEYLDNTSIMAIVIKK